MLLAFEGTGPDSMTRADFWKHNGFIAQFVNKYAVSKKKEYFDGPSASGADVPGIFADGCASLRAYLAGRDRAVHIVGYSRGAFIAMAVARYCWEELHTPVQFLGLFDAVSRASTLGKRYDSDTISTGVQYCFHAQRNPASGSRQDFPYFGGTGQAAEKGVKFDWTCDYMTSHSGMGGWPNAGDLTGAAVKQREWDESTRAGVWASNRARQHGVLSGVLAPVKF